MALILSKHYYGALSKTLEKLEIDRYFSVLYYLNGVKTCSQQQICNALAIDKTAMVKVMDYLIKSGYVHRQINPADRREHFVALTALGKRRTQHVVRAFHALDRVAFKALSDREKKEFNNTASILLRNLSEQPANDLFFNYKKTKRVKLPALK